MTDPEPDRGTVTHLLDAVAREEPGAAEKLWERIHDELRAEARRQMAKEAPGHTLQTTALVNEVYIRLMGGKPVNWDNRAHFFGAAIRSMEQILKDWAKKKKAKKRPPRDKRVDFESVQPVFRHDPGEVLEISEAIERLERIDKRKADIVRLCYFGELMRREVAALLGVSETLVKTEFSFSKAWLHRELNPDDPEPGGGGAAEGDGQPPSASSADQENPGEDAERA